MRIPRRGTGAVATGSATWWRRALFDVCVRLAALTWLVVKLVSGHIHGWRFGLGIAFAVVMALLLVFPVGACVSVLLGKHEKNYRQP